MKQIGLTLSGGAIRGITHLGVLKALDEFDIVPQIVTGTSMGSIIAGLYATGMSYSDILKIVSEVNSKIFEFSTKEILISLWKKEIPIGAVKTNKLESIIDDATGGIIIKDIKDKKLGIVATNLNGGQNVIFTNSEMERQSNNTYIDNVKLSLAIRASISLPVIFKPVQIEDMILVDGGIVNNCPIDVAQELGAEFIIASDIDYNGGKIGTILTGSDVLMATIDVVVRDACRDNFMEVKVPYVTINFGDVPNVSLLDFTKEDIDQMFKIGYERAKKVLDVTDKKLLK
jgi:NTE family protein